MVLANIILVLGQLCMMGVVAILDANLGFFESWRLKLEAGPNISKWIRLVPRFRIGFRVVGTFLFFAGLAVNAYAWSFPGVVHRSTLILCAQVAVTILVSCFFGFEWLVCGRGFDKEAAPRTPAWELALFYALTIYMFSLFIVDGSVPFQRLNRDQTHAAQLQLESDELDHAQEQKSLMRDASAAWLWFGFALGRYVPCERKKQGTPFGEYRRNLQKLQ